MSVLLLIRHAQAAFGEEDYDRVSELGLEQARALGAALRQRYAEVHAVVTGTHLRHTQTAEACLASWESVPPARRFRGFDEVDYTALLLRLEPRYADRAEIAGDILASDDPRQALQDLFTRAVARWTTGQFDAEYDETWPAFRLRCVDALEEVIRGLGRSETAFIFTSGGPITAICQQLLGLPDSEAFRIAWTLVNCGITKLLHNERGLRLSTLNEHAHFEGERRSLITYR